MRARDNPFATDRIEALTYQCQPLLFEDLLQRLELLNWRAAIVGPQGSGKTTLLEALQPRLQKLGFKTRLMRANAEIAAGRGRLTLRDLSSATIVLLDGADLLSAWSWYLWYRKARTVAAGMVITTHQPGRLPTLVTCHPDLNMLDSIISELTGRDVDSQMRSLTGELYRKHRGNMREVLREWYDIYAQRP